MSKKVRRTRKPSPSRGTSREKFVEPPQKQADDFQVEYAYVVKDLRTVFILAGLMFILLIALNLVIQ